MFLSQSIWKKHIKNKIWKGKLKIISSKQDKSYRRQRWGRNIPKANLWRVRCPSLWRFDQGRHFHIPNFFTCSVIQKLRRHRRLILWSHRILRCTSKVHRERRALPNGAAQRELSRCSTLLQGLVTDLPHCVPFTSLLPLFVRCFFVSLGEGTFTSWLDYQNENFTEKNLKALLTLTTSGCDRSFYFSSPEII